MTETLSPAEQAMQANGQSIDEPVYEDYFGFEETHTWYFPDGKQYILFQTMNEGARARYQRATSKDVRLFKQTGDASIKVDPSEERHILFEQSVKGWYIFRNGREVPFGPHAGSGSEFHKWLMGANPKLVSSLELAIRKANPWLMNEQTVAEIDKQIEELKELRASVEAREEGKDAS